MTSHCAFVGQSSFTPSLRCGQHTTDQRHVHPLSGSSMAQRYHVMHLSRLNDRIGSSTTAYLAALPSAAMLSLTDPNSLSASTKTTFAAVVPETPILVGFVIITIVCAIAANVWANQVVPISRTKLAIAKQKNSNSTLRQYLDDLLEVENANMTVNDTTTLSAAAMEDAIYRNVHEAETIGDGGMIGRAKGNRAFERWLFTDWLVKDSQVRKSGRQKEPAIPILKSAKWNSGDNPVLVATTLIFLGVVLTSVSERITTLLTI